MVNEVIGQIISMLDGGYLAKQNTFVSEMIVRDSVADGPFR
jgi:LacI family asc operon transcriptional repressor